MFGFLKFIRISSLLFKDKRWCHNNKKPRKNVMFDYMSPRVNTAEFCQNVLMVSVVFKAWWLPLITNVDIISINLTQWISLFSKIWVFTACVNALCVSHHNYLEEEQVIPQLISVHNETEMYDSGNAKIGQKYKEKNLNTLFVKMNRLHKNPSEIWSRGRLIISSQPSTTLILFDSFTKTRCCRHSSLSLMC